jgi:CBS domain containing-hemolysin-like protein
VDINYISIYEAAIFCLILLSAFFSGYETSLISSSRIKIETDAKNGIRSAERALYILDRMEDAIGTILIGNNSANIGATAFITFLATRAFLLDEKGLLVVTLIQTTIFLVLCEVSPKVIARSKPESFLKFFSYPIIFLMTVLKPFIWLSLFVSKLLNRRIKADQVSSSIVRSRDELDLLFKLGRKEGIIYKDHQIYISEILSFRDVTAYEIMTPVVDVESVDMTTGIKKLAELIQRTGFSRIPVFDRRVDHIVGYIFFRDLLKNPGVKELKEIITKPYYVPGTKNIYELYQEMYDNSIPIVFVVNEYGGVIGMVSNEDIAEEVVGEIQTSDHEEDKLIVRVSEKKYILSGDLNIDYFQRHFGVPVEKHGFKTVAGFITYHLKKIPKKGDRLIFKNTTFVIDEATERSVEKIVMYLKGSNRGK